MEYRCRITCKPIEALGTCVRNFLVSLVSFYCKCTRVQRKLAKNRARQLYKNISMLFLFPVKDGKLSIGVIAIFNASCYG